jgi:hypothetical protein
MKKQVRRFAHLLLSLMLLATTLLGLAGPAAADTVVSNGAVTLKGTWSFNCETGVVGSGGDIFWDQLTSTQRQMTPKGSAKIVNLGLVDFNTIDAAQLASYQYATAPIPGNNDSTNQLVDNDVFAVFTNDGDYAKILVVSYGYDLSIQWTTYSPPASTTTPVTGVSP